MDDEQNQYHDEHEPSDRADEATTDTENHAAQTGEHDDADPGAEQADAEADEDVEAESLSDGTGESEPFEPTEGRRRIANPANVEVLGILTVEFPERSVSVIADGDAAMRVLEAHRRGGSFHQDLACRLDPYSSSAENGWFTLDPSSALLISWMPGLPPARRRMAVDPALPAVAG